MPDPVFVTFMPEDVTVTAYTGDTLLDAALDNHVPLPHDCGGNCACITCHVRIRAGAECLSRVEEPEADRLATASSREDASRLGCQALLRRPGAVILERVEEGW